jgi:hypothetical protein
MPHVLFHMGMSRRRSSAARVPRFTIHACQWFPSYSILLETNVPEYVRFIIDDDRNDFTYAFHSDLLSTMAMRVLRTLIFGRLELNRLFPPPSLMIARPLTVVRP